MEGGTTNHINVAKVLASKGIRPRRWMVRLLNRLLHIDEINECLDLYGDKEGVEFAQAIMNHLDITFDLRHLERIPREGSPIIIANHPLGGPDAMALIAAVGSVRDDILFPVNDFLMFIKQLKPIFVPIDKVHGNRNTADGINAAFAGENTMLYFPAGLCSRRVKGQIVDLQWKPTVIRKAIQHHRDLIPVHIEARNRRRFYTIANWRKRLGIKFNFEMALLPGEMFAQRGKTFRLTVGEPIPWQTLNDGDMSQAWADKLHDQIYTIR